MKVETEKALRCVVCGKTQAASGFKVWRSARLNIGAHVRCIKNEIIISGPMRPYAEQLADEFIIHY